MDNSMISAFQAAISTALHSKQSHSITLFHKLQLFDKLRSKFNLNPNYQPVIAIYQSILAKQTNSYLEKNSKTVPINLEFDSPPQNKFKAKNQQGIQDPQQFSFSKSQFYDQTKPNQPQHQDNMLSNFHIYSDKIKAIHQQYSNRNKTHQHRSRWGNRNVRVRQISEFMGEPNNIAQIESYQINQQQTKSPRHSIHCKNNHLINHIKAVNFRLLMQTLKSNIQDRKNNLRIKSASYLHTASLIKKSFASLRNYGSYMKQSCNNFKQKKIEGCQKSYFLAWKSYSNRSEEQRMAELQLEKKYQKVTRYCGLKRFVKNCKESIYGEIHEQGGEGYRKQKKQLFREKQELLKQAIKRYSISGTFSKMKRSHECKNHIEISYKELKFFRLKASINLFIRLLGCLNEVAHHKQGKLINTIRYKIYGKTLISKLTAEYHFQNVYWNNKNQTNEISSFQTQQLLPVYSLTKCPNYSYLRYSKILLIHHILSYAEQQLYRKGYFNQKNLFTSDAEYNNHPAIKQYLQPYITKKYFKALKGLVQQRKDKVSALKFEIGKNRLLYPLLDWYKESIREKLNKQYINLKFVQLYRERLNTHTKHVLLNLKQYSNTDCIQIKYSLLEQSLDSSRAKGCIHFLKKNNAIKKFYIARIKQFTSNGNHRILETIFLEWKLVHMRKLHLNYLTLNLLSVIKQSSLKLLVVNSREMKINRAIFDKRLQWMKKNIILREGNLLIKNLKTLFHIKNQQNIILKRDQTYIKKTKETLLKQYLKRRAGGQFIRKLQAIKQYQLYNKTLYHTVIPQYRKRRTQLIIFKTLVKIKQINKEEQRKTGVIIGRSKKNTKKKCIDKMVERLLLSITLKRMSNVLQKWIKVKYFPIIKQTVSL